MLRSGNLIALSTPLSNMASATSDEPVCISPVATTLNSASHWLSVKRSRSEIMAGLKTMVKMVRSAVVMRFVALIFFLLGGYGAAGRIRTFISTMFNAAAQTTCTSHVDTSISKLDVACSSTGSNDWNREDVEHVEHHPCCRGGEEINEEQNMFRVGRRAHRCGMLTTSTVHMGKATVGNIVDIKCEGAERPRRLFTVFRRRAQPRLSSNDPIENDADKNTSRLIPLINFKSEGSRSKKRFGKHAGIKIRRAFKKVGRAVRRAVVPSTETVGNVARDC